MRVVRPGRCRIETLVLRSCHWADIRTRPTLISDISELRSWFPGVTRDTASSPSRLPRFQLWPSRPRKIIISIYRHIDPGFSHAGSRHQMGSVGSFLRIAAKLWGRGVAGAASNVEEYNAWSIIDWILYVQHGYGKIFTILMYEQRS